MFEVNEWTSAPAGIRVSRRQDMYVEPRDVAFADLERLEVLRAPGVGGPPSRSGRDVLGSLVVLGGIAGAAATAEDGHEFGQNLLVGGLAMTGGFVGFVLLRLACCHLFSHWEAIPIPK